MELALPDQKRVLFPGVAVHFVRLAGLIAVQDHRGLILLGEGDKGISLRDSVFDDAGDLPSLVAKHLTFDHLITGVGLLRLCSTFGHRCSSWRSPRAISWQSYSGLWQGTSGGKRDARGRDSGAGDGAGIRPGRLCR